MQSLKILLIVFALVSQLANSDGDRTREKGKKSTARKAPINFKALLLQTQPVDSNDKILTRLLKTGLWNQRKALRLQKALSKEIQRKINRMIQGAVVRFFPGLLHVVRVLHSAVYKLMAVTE